MDFFGKKLSEKIPCQNAAISCWVEWAIPILLFLLIAPWTPEIDLAISHFFYSSTHFVKAPWITFFYHWGPWLAWIVSFAAAALLILSFSVTSFKKWRQATLLWILTYAIGAGVIIHLILKVFWQRPRPVQTINFGGFAPYHPFWIRITEEYAEAARSFACGHCTAGFIFFTLFLIGRRMQKDWLKYTGLILGAMLGIGLSLLRIAQGGHYFSDTMAAALIIWLTALIFDAFIYRDQPCRR